MTVYYVKPVLRSGADVPEFITAQDIDINVGLGFETAYEAVMWAKVVQTHPDVLGTEISPPITP